MSMGFEEPTKFEYTEENIYFAKCHIDSMEADFGGTNIYSPLDKVLYHRKSDSEEFQVGDPVKLRSLMKVP